MKKATAKLMFLCALFLVTNIYWMLADTGVKRTMALSGTPSQPPPKPGPSPVPGPVAPDGGSIPACYPGTTGCNN